MKKLIRCIAFFIIGFLIFQVLTYVFVPKWISKIDPATPRFKEFYELEKNSTSKKQCENCMYYKNGDCGGNSQICDEYRHSPEISKEEVDRWPKYGSVSRSKSDKFIIREYDGMYD